MIRKIILMSLAALAVAAPAAIMAGNFVGGGSGFPGDPNIVGSGDPKDIQTAAFRTGLSGADTLTTSGILTTTEFVLKGRQILIVAPRFSASGANCKIRVAYVYKSNLAIGANSTDTGTNFIKGLSDERTITAGTVQYEGAYYPPVAGNEYFDGEGAIAVRVLVTQAPSSGTVAFWVGSK